MYDSIITFEHISTHFQIQRRDEFNRDVQPNVDRSPPYRLAAGHRLHLLLQQPGQVDHHRRHSLRRSVRLQLQDLLGLEEEKDGKYLRGAIEIIVYT